MEHNMLEKGKNIEIYRQMLTIRRFEEAIFDLYREGKMPGLAHLYTGEEAVAVGVCMALNPDDYITSTHRGHGHILAKGGEPRRMMAEVTGRVDGYCRGKGGEMHIADFKLGILGANGIVGGGLGIATGAAFSAKKRQTGQVSVAFFGEGAVNQGIFYETINMASVWKLPLIYICENNQYGEYTSWTDITAGEKIIDRPIAMRAAAVSVDGNDPLAVYGATLEAVKRARQGEGPSFIECLTYRYTGHHVGEPGRDYRSEEEIEEWHRRDPIPRFEKYLLEKKISSGSDIEEIQSDVEREIVEAVEFALAAPYPELDELTQHVFAEER
jgi:acetoin:2,6-dichlorophenolindophenol oxidoreductase subunit alpha